MKKNIKLEHINNLIAVAFADGNFNDEEIEFLYEKAEEFDISEAEVKKSVDNANNLTFMVPQNNEDKEDQLADIVFMMMIDGIIHDKEYDLCLSITSRLNLEKEDLDDVISLTKRLWDSSVK